MDVLITTETPRDLPAVHTGQRFSTRSHFTRFALCFTVPFESAAEAHTNREMCSRSVGRSSLA
jgi:hypothetical protein